MVLPLKAIISRHTRKDGTAVIYYQYCFSSTNRILLSTEIAIPPAFWNAKRQAISKLLPITSGDPQHLNSEINRMRKTIEVIIEHGIATREPDMGAYVSGIFRPNFKIESLKKATAIIPQRKKDADFFTELDNYNKSKEKQVSENCMGPFNTFRQRMWAFEEYRKEKITFAALDYNFYLELVEFLTYDYKHKRRLQPEYGLKVSSIGKTINQLRVFVRDRVRRKIIQSFNMEDFKILDEETDSIYLTYDEIGRIYNLDLSHDLTLALYRDMFVLGCLTGLRFSDYSTLRGTDMRNGLLYKKTNKTDNWVVIPLRCEAAEIFKRRFQESTANVSNAVFNRYIKEIGEMAGITQPITFTHKKGNRDVSETRPKSQWITSHTCRRSFCTNEYLAGTEVSLIMKISGHKTHKQFFKYIRVTQEEAARKIQEVWSIRNNMQAFPLSKGA